MIKKILFTLICTYIPLSHAETFLGDPESCIPEKNFMIVDKYELEEYEKKTDTGEATVYRHKNEILKPRFLGEAPYDEKTCQDGYCNIFDPDSFSFVETELDGIKNKGIYITEKIKTDNSIKLCDDGTSPSNEYCFKSYKGENTPKSQYHFFLETKENGDTVQRLYNSFTKKDVYLISNQEIELKSCQIYFKSDKSLRIENFQALRRSLAY